MALVTSVPRPVDGRPPLLGADDIDAIFHEFGHVLDFALARERILPRPSWAPRDWTEAPSQFLGRWALHADVVRGYARHNVMREAIPDATARALQQSLDLNSGIRALRLLSMAKVDIAFHTLAEGDDIDVDRIDREAFETRGVPAIPGTMFAAAFAHPWTGYDGACYGFLWSQVLLSEIWERFDRDGATSSVVGAAYRREILELGWADDPVAGLTRFLGRPPGEEAFLRRLALPSSSPDA